MRLVILFIALMLIMGCAVKSPSSNKIQIVATISPLKEFTEIVGGDSVEVYQLLPAGADPHSWEPRPTDLQRITDADIFIFIGSGFEPWTRTLPGLEGKTLIEAGKIIDLIEHEDDDHEDEGSDPHLWLDVDNDMKIMDAITEELTKKSPEDEEIFLQNSYSYKEKLDAMDDKYRLGLKDCKFNKFIVGGHSAFSYLAERYGLEQIAVSGLSPDAEPSAQRIAEIIDILEDTEIKYIIFEKITNPKVAEVIAAETGAETLEMDTGVATDKSFLKTMDDNLKILKTVLECQ